MSKNKFSKILSLAAVALMLTSCGEITNLPADKNDPIVNVDDVKDQDINFNDKEEIYDSITTSNSIYAKQLEIVLNDIAKKELQKEGFEVSKVTMLENVYKKMIDAATGGSYSKDNIFEEYRYAITLLSSMYNIKYNDKLVDDSVRNKGFKGVVTPETKYVNGKVSYKDQFEKIFKYDYSDYIEKELLLETERQYLTAKYIYENNYSSIGNTNARDVVVLKLQDVIDHPGSASAFLGAGYKKIEDGTYDLYDLARIYKGVNLSSEEQEWVKSNNLITMKSKIDEDWKNLQDNIKNPNSEYANLENDFTGSYTYPIEHGKELKLNSLSSQDLITSGLFLKSNGIADLNDTLKNRVFTTNIPTKGEENTYFEEVHGNYYVKPEKSESSSKATSIINYDSAASAYYIIQVNDFVTSAAIAKRDGDSEEVKASKKELALRVAFEMASSESYKNDAIVHYLKEAKIEYSDPDFYKYIKDTYPKVFEDKD